MKLICAATQLEVQYLLNKGFEPIEKNLFQFQREKEVINILISGVGIHTSVFELTKELLTRTYSQVINIGVAGAYHSNLKLTQLVEIEKENFSDFGIRTNEGFESMLEMEFYKEELLDDNGYLKTKPVTNLPKVLGNTVNSVNGSFELSESTLKQNPAEVESMEGAAIFYTCMKLGIAVNQIRSISNYVGERNKSRWEMNKSIKNLNHYIWNRFIK